MIIFLSKIIVINRLTIIVQPYLNVFCNFSRLSLWSPTVQLSRSTHPGDATLASNLSIPLPRTNQHTRASAN